MTFCVSNNLTSRGWKSKNREIYLDKYSLEFYCKNATTVLAAMECIDEHTYSRNETILSNNFWTSLGYLSTDDPLWIEDYSELFYHGFVLLLIKQALRQTRTL